MITYGDLKGIDFGLPWPGYDKKDYSGVDAGSIAADYERRVQVERRALVDPVQFGWTLASWREFFGEYAKYHTHVICGGNRASKSVCVARLYVFLLQAIPECRLRAFHVSSAKSITEQQQHIWDALPRKYKDLSGKKSGTFSTTYSQRNGFVGDKLILPPQEGCSRGSELIFGNYQQYRNDPQVVEGWWAHGVWCDEECPQKMFERLLTRVFDVRGRLILSFTTIQGWSALVADVLGKTKTLKRRYSQLLNREIPVAQESLTRKSTRIYYFWTEDNPFIPSDTIENLRGRPEAEILALAHGIPTRSATTKFPKFSEVHVLKEGQLPWKKEGVDYEPITSFTTYLVVDPSGAKPWFMIWAAVSRAGDIYIYRDWPDIGYGSWGEPSEREEGSPGQAMKPNGFGIYDYVDTIKELETEDGAEVFERIIDPRLGAARVPGKEGATSIMSELQDAGMVFIPAPGLDINHGQQLISDRMGYDETQPVSALNHPRLYVSEHCEQVIEAFKNYTGCSRTEVWKDPVDTVRYLLESGADFVEKRADQDSGKTFSY